MDIQTFLINTKIQTFYDDLSMLWSGKDFNPFHYGEGVEMKGLLITDLIACFIHATRYWDRISVPGLKTWIY